MLPLEGKLVRAAKVQGRVGVMGMWVKDPEAKI